MRRWLILAGIGGLLLAGLARALPVRTGKKEITYLDLQPKANMKLKEVRGGLVGNDLAGLTTGEQKFGGVKFKIGERYIQLAGNVMGDLAKVEGIKVGKPFAKLYILHAAGTTQKTPENTVIAKYVVHYKDKTKKTIDIVKGKDVRDWWHYPNAPDVTRGKVAWTGENQAVKKYRGTLRIYLTTWQNPQPKKEVSHIDYISTRTTPAQPFCLALTVEGK
jgi:hypothetical protein